MGLAFRVNLTGRAMRILQIANRSPWPPHNGAALRPYHALRALKARGDEVRVFAFAPAGEYAQAVTGCAGLADGATIVDGTRLHRWSGALQALATGKPLSVGWFRHAGLARAIDAALREHTPDAILVHSANVAAYVPPAWLARTWLDMTDVDSQKFVDYARTGSAPMRWIHGLEARRLRRYECWLLERVGGACLVTERERALLLPLLGASARERLLAIPNGVDTDLFTPPDAAGAGDARGTIPEAERIHLAGAGPNLVFVGVMDYPPNVDAAVWFAREILPRVRRRHPQARLLIVGARPNATVRALATLDGVRVTGFVEASPPWFRAATVCVLPLRIARGIQNKALEAMACACPVVSTRTVAEGVGARDGEHLRVADDAPAFADAVSGLLEAPAEGRALGARARRHVEAHFAWAPQMARLLGALDARIGAARMEQAASAEPGARGFLR
jgi:sugar transferase (PEP-CTERM/EpsH1 system associated)